MNMYLARKNGIQRYQTKIFVFKPGSVITAGNETIFVEPQLISEQKVNSLKNVNNSRKRTLLITTQAHTAPLPRTPTRRTNEGNRTRTHTRNTPSRAAAFPSRVSGSNWLGLDWTDAPVAPNPDSPPSAPPGRHPPPPPSPIPPLRPCPCIPKDRTTSGVHSIF